MSDPDRDPTMDPRFLAAYDLLGRSGATKVELRYQDDEQPTIWISVGYWNFNGQTRHETAAALSPVKATLRLLERVIDGGMCVHCNKPTAVDIDLTPDLHPMLPDTFCWYQYDPELKTFRRSCEGDDAPS